MLDLGPPDSTLTLDLWLAADVPILVTLPDPASIEATYRFVKSGFVRRLRTTRGLDKLVTNPQGPPRAALDLYRAARDGGGPAERLEQEIRRYRPRFIVNQTRTLPDLKLGGWMSAAARRRLGHAFDYLGHVESDETVWLAARRRRPLLAEYPEAKVAKNIERIARRILSLESERDRERERPPAAPLRLEEEQTYYEILETEPGVSDEEVRRAYRTLKEIYGASSPVVAGLYDEHELADLHARANAAHDTLFAPERRRLYDLALPEADLARAVRARPRTTRADRACPPRTTGTSRPSPSSTWARTSAAPCCARSARRAASSSATSRSARRSASATCAPSRTSASATCPPPSTCAATSWAPPPGRPTRWASLKRTPPANRPRRGGVGESGEPKGCSGDRRAASARPSTA